MRLRVMCCPGLGAERGRLSTGRPATPTSCLSPLEAGIRIWNSARGWSSPFWSFARSPCWRRAYQQLSDGVE